MPGSRHRFEFEGQEPLGFWIIVALLLANTILMLVLSFAEKFPPGNVPKVVHWYEANSIIIQFVLLALLAAILIVFRKRLRYVRQK